MFPTWCGSAALLAPELSGCVCVVAMWQEQSFGAGPAWALQIHTTAETQGLQSRGRCKTGGHGKMSSSLSPPVGLCPSPPSLLKGMSAKITPGYTALHLPAAACPVLGMASEVPTPLCPAVTRTMSPTHSRSTSPPSPAEWYSLSSLLTPFGHFFEPSTPLVCKQLSGHARSCS